MHQDAAQQDDVKGEAEPMGGSKGWQPVVNPTDQGVRM
jgi:hypothetical protein